jgi:hypothetical protein
MRKIKELGTDPGKDLAAPQSIDITARELKLIADDLAPEQDDNSLAEPNTPADPENLPT